MIKEDQDSDVMVDEGGSNSVDNYPNKSHRLTHNKSTVVIWVAMIIQRKYLYIIYTIR